MVIASDPGQQAVGPDRLAGRLTQIGHRQGVGPGAGRFGGQSPEERPRRVGELEEREVGGDPYRLLEKGEEKQSHRGAPDGDEGTIAHAPEHLAHPPPAEHAEGERPERVSPRGERHREVHRLPAPEDADAEGAGRPAEEAEDERLIVGEDPLGADEERKHRRGRDREPPVPEHRDQHRRERHRGELGPVGDQLVEQRRADDREADDPRQRGQLAKVGVAFAAIEREEEPEGGEEEEVERNGQSWRVTGLRERERRHPGHGGEQCPTDQVPSGVDDRPLGAHPL